MLINYRPSENETLHPSTSLNETSSQTLQVPHIKYGLSSVGGGINKILDTGDLSHAELAYNNITFQMYPGLKFTNERSSGTDVRTREDKLDTYNLSQG